jgi:hypothetical protein
MGPGLLGPSGIDPETVWCLGDDVDRAGAAEPDPTRRAAAVARRDPSRCATAAATLSELRAHGLGRTRRPARRDGSMQSVVAKGKVFSCGIIVLPAQRIDPQASLRVYTAKQANETQRPAR